jgi:glycerophosphoryl diester phosphodiesterase
MCRIVAHRGQPSTFPENTLEGIQEAVRCGATAVEFDVQMTADQVPVVCHDISLIRTAGVDLDISQHQYDEIKTINVGEPARFSEQYKSVTLSSLQDVLLYIQSDPGVLAFVELKEESIDAFGIDSFIEPIIELLLPVKEQCIVIAENLQALTILKQRTNIPIGWIIHRWQQDDFDLAEQQGIDYLVINHKYCPDGYDFTLTPWKWVIYETRNPDKTVRLFEQGADFVETDDVCQLINRLPGYK